MKSPKSGSLVIIGGREDKEGEKAILREFVELAGKRKICVAKIASRLGDEAWEEYEHVFRQLGVEEITHLGVSVRRKSDFSDALEALEDADAVFFTGGDQLRITSEIGGTVVEKRILEIFAEGGVIGGTSAGASVMSSTMLISGNGERSPRIGDRLRMAPGLGLIDDVLIDQHFTERGRIGRLLGALAHNPRYLGIGLDENTAIIVRDGSFRVVGEGGVTVIDATCATESNISDADTETSLSLFNTRLHLLSSGDRFDLAAREPTRKPLDPGASASLPEAGENAHLHETTPHEALVAHP